MVSLRPSEGRKAGLRTIENRLPSIARWNVSATIRAPDAREPAVVELGLAQDVEPQRRPRDHRVLLGGRQVVELGAAVAGQDLVPGQRCDGDTDGS